MLDAAPALLRDKGLGILSRITIGFWVYLLGFGL